MPVRARKLATSAVARFGIFVTAGAVALQSVLNYANIVLFDRRYPKLDADAELGVAAWQSSAAQFAAAILVLLLAARFPSRRVGLLTLAAVLAYFSADDILAVHEQIGRIGADALGVPDVAPAVWPVLYLPLFAIVVIGVWRIGAEFGGEAERLLRAGLALLAVGMAVELITPGLRELDLLRFVSEVVAEEGAELAGWGLVATGLAVSVAGLFEAP